MKFKFVLLLVVLASSGLFAQLKIGYVDSDAIMKNLTDAEDAKRQLDALIVEWQNEISKMESDIKFKKDDFEKRKLILTDQMRSDIDAEIKQLEKDMEAYRTKKFGTGGELFVKQDEVMKPVQNKVFTAIQDIAVAKKYDFVFDKSSDLTMLFADKRFDISEQVLRVLNRSEKREQLTKKQLKEEELKENREDALDENPIVAERQKALDDKKTSREKILADRKLLQEQKKK